MLELPLEAPKFKYTDGNQLLMIPYVSEREKGQVKNIANFLKGSYIEEMYGIASTIKRKKLLLEVEALLQTRRRQRHEGAEGFEIQNWKKIDILDWLHHDVKLPEYAESFERAPLDGLLLVSLTSKLLKTEFGIKQARHRRRIYLN